MTTSFSRREFLKGSLAAGGLTMIAVLTPTGVKLANASGTEGETAGLQPFAYYVVTPENIVKIMVPSSEMGQGIRTTLPMIVADELEADWDKVEILQAPAADAFKSPILNMQMTVASASTRGWYMPLRKAGAAGRAMLTEAAAKKWNVPVSECKAEKGAVRHDKSKKSLSYGELANDAAKLPVPKDTPLKKDAEFRYIGKYMPRTDIPEKVSGKAVFGYDVNLPDLHFAVLSRPPAYGAKPESFDEKAAMGVDGVAKVVPTPFGVAVCAKSLHAAQKGRDALNVKWSPGSHPDLDTASLEKNLRGLLDKPGVNAFTRGDPKKALGEAKKVFEAEYYIPCVAHVTMEPMNFTAHVQKDRCDLYGPTQAQTITQGIAAKVSGLPPEKISINTTLLGCGLGRRARPEFAIEAIIASKALGKPVKVLYSREEDIKGDFFRAPMTHRIKAGLDDKGDLIAWDHKTASISISKGMGMPLKDGVDGYLLWGLVDTDQSPYRCPMAYTIPNYSVDLVLSDLPVPVTPWRSVQNAPNAFATESFIDELAHLAGKDPLEFRLQVLKDNKRASHVLKTLAQKSNWGKPLPEGRGRGIAQHYCFGTSIAQVVEVSVEKDGTIKVHRVDAAVDCGPVVNPDALIAQIEGAVTMALSTALFEEVQFAKGGVASDNFGDYRVIRMSEVPEINVHMIENNDPAMMGGIGEPGVTPLAPAVANAVFNVTGKRIRRMPVKL
ncbi:MAG: xanthine dehydrogenase family protein molybdopterin-binding subunit [Pseudomonadota bacterium]